jgi:hypothetical protein
VRPARGQDKCLDRMLMPAKAQGAPRPGDKLLAFLESL